jgi:hypothetical protein
MSLISCPDDGSRPNRKCPAPFVTFSPQSVATALCQLVVTHPSELLVPMGNGLGRLSVPHTDLPWPPPSSALAAAVLVTSLWDLAAPASNYQQRSRSLPDLTGRLTARAGDGHAPPLSSSGKVFSLTLNLLSLLVSFLALTPIEPQASPLVVLPRQFL